MSDNKRPSMVMIDGNEATVRVAYAVNEVCAIYPITPSSPMAELADEWASKGVKNIWGHVPEIIEMQSEGGAAGTLHGALQAGGLTTTFTASQGLLLMIPNMYKIAGELTPCVFHVAARSIATQALSIFGDHSDVMTVRMTGFSMLASASVQEAHDMALIAQAATLGTRIPMLHFFDGFRTSHEVNKITLLTEQQIRSLINDDLVMSHRERSLNPNRPVIRGTAHNPDVYFQGRESVNPYYLKAPETIRSIMQDFFMLTGRSYDLFEYSGHPKAERVMVIMGSGAETAIETARELESKGEKVGVVKVRLFRPFSIEHLIRVLPKETKSVAVLDRTKESGAIGEPLYQDVLLALSDALSNRGIQHLPAVIGGRFGLSSKEFTPGMVKSIFDELKKESPLNHFTIGIFDDLTHTSLDYDSAFEIKRDTETSCIFYGLGADGTVGANKNSIKIIGEHTDLYAQGYFVYDSKKSGSQTVSHLRFGKDPIRAPYLIISADFVACHQFNFIYKTDVLKFAAPGAVFLLNCPLPKDKVWEELPGVVQKQIIDKKLRLFVIDATKVALESGMGRRINTIMQTCFFALANILPKEEAIEKIKETIRKTYFKKGEMVIRKNFKAVDAALSNLFEVDVGKGQTSHTGLKPAVPGHAPDFVQNVIAAIINNEGDALPVSALPDDGTYPSGTTKWEKRDIADFVPVWEPDICIQCGNCSFVCPHSVIRAKFYHKDNLTGAPETFQSAPISARGFPETRYSLQIYSEDCTGCQLCVEACPALSLQESRKKAINMRQKDSKIIEDDRKNIAFFESLPLNDRTEIDFSSVRGAQFLEPLFEFSGACAGCGETPYLKLLTQLFGDRLMIANATGCSSIYGGNLPTTPWTTNKEGRGPAWSNSLFEDNAEFGLGMRIAADKHLEMAHDLLDMFVNEIGEDLANELKNAPQKTESEIRKQRERVAELKVRLLEMDETREVKSLLSLADQFVRRSIWLVGGDGWAYDIGSSGVDHVLSTGRDVNILVLDTEVYSNTGGQMSKATPTAATAKFAAGGKTVIKKDLAMQAISYGNIYVAQIAMGGNPQQTLQAIREAEAYPGPSLILAYSHCIAHGILMEKGLDQQKLAVSSGYWPLLRYNPALRSAGYNPFVLDSPRARIPVKDYAYKEMRYKILTLTNPEKAERLMQLAQQFVDWRYKSYEDMAGMDASEFQPVL